MENSRRKSPSQPCLRFLPPYAAISNLPRCMWRQRHRAQRGRVCRGWASLQLRVHQFVETAKPSGFWRRCFSAGHLRCSLPATTIKQHLSSFKFIFARLHLAFENVWKLERSNRYYRTDTVKYPLRVGASVNQRGIRESSLDLINVRDSFNRENGPIFRDCLCAKGWQ